MAGAVSPEAPPIVGRLRTTNEASRELRLHSVLLLWLTHTENVRRIQVGQARVYDDQAIAEIEAAYKRLDPEEKFRVPEGRKSGRPVEQRDHGN